MADAADNEARQANQTRLLKTCERDLQSALDDVKHARKMVDNEAAIGMRVQSIRDATTRVESVLAKLKQAAG